MTQPARYTRCLLCSVAAALLVSSSRAVSVSAAGPLVPTYTGCYSATSGTINKLKLGETPQKPCNAGDIQVSFSAGDITKISVTGGLTGGGTNGELSISLDAKYALPQSCALDAVAKWNGTQWVCGTDQNTAYTAGTDLELSALNAFSVQSAYQLPQGCADGEIATKSGAGWTCVAAPFQPIAYTVAGPTFVSGAVACSMTACST